MISREMKNRHIRYSRTPLSEVYSWISRASRVAYADKIGVFGVAVRLKQVDWTPSMSPVI